MRTRQPTIDEFPPRIGKPSSLISEWLWPGRLALGKLTILAGGTMSGKSFLTADLAARAANRLDWPDATRAQPEAGGEITPAAPPGRVLIVPGGPSRTRRLWPRLAAAGADLGKIVVETVDRGKVASDQLVFWLDDALTRAGDCKLVMIEPPAVGFSSRGAELDEASEALLQALAELAARRDVAVLVVVGLRHDFAAPVSKRQLGALASCDAAICVWALLRDEAAPELRYLVTARSSEADDRKALAFRIRQNPSCAPGAAARVEWRTQALATADGASRAFGGECSRRAERIDAMRWLTSLLGEGAIAVTKIQSESAGAGYSWATIRRARQELPVRAVRNSIDGDMHWFWQLESERWIAGQSRIADDEGPRDVPLEQGAQLAGQDAQLALETNSRLTPAALLEQGAQLAGQDAQLALETNSRLTPAARQRQGAQLAGQDAQLALETNSRLTPAARQGQDAQLAGQDAQLALEINSRLTPAARQEQGAQLAAENGRWVFAGGAARDRGALAKSKRKRKEERKAKRLKWIGSRVPEMGTAK